MLRTLDGFTMEGYVIGAYILLMECVNEKSRQLYASQFRSLQVRVVVFLHCHKHRYIFKEMTLSVLQLLQCLTPQGFGLMAIAVAAYLSSTWKVLCLVAGESNLQFTGESTLVIVSARF